MSYFRVVKFDRSSHWNVLPRKFGMMVDVLAIKEIQKKRGSKIFCAYVNEKNERKLGWLELTKEIR